MKILVLLTINQAKLAEDLLWTAADATRSLVKARVLEQGARNIRTSLTIYEHPEFRVGPKIPFLERLAALEHKQWKTWATGILNEEPISHDRRIRWQLLASVPYRALPEEHKEADRIWARKVLELLEMEGIRWP